MRLWNVCAASSGLRWRAPTNKSPMNTPARSSAAITVPQQIALLAAMRPVHAAFAWFQLRENELRRLQLEIAQIPAPPFGEGPRALWLRNKFVALGLQHVEIDEIGNVIGVFPG